MDNSDAWAMRAAHKGDPDWTLDLLIRLVEDSGGAFPLTVLVNGIFIKGLLVNSTEWADFLDGSMDRVLKTVAESIAQQTPIESVDELVATENLMAGDVEQRRAAWPDQGWRKYLDDRRAEHRALLDRLNSMVEEGETVPLESLPEDLAETAAGLELPRPAFTLKDALVFSFGPGGEGGLRLPFTRVVASHVDAWWPGELGSSADAA